MLALSVRFMWMWKVVQWIVVQLAKQHYWMKRVDWLMRCQPTSHALQHHKGYYSVISNLHILQENLKAILSHYCRLNSALQ